MQELDGRAEFMAEIHNYFPIEFLRGLQDGEHKSMEVVTT